MATMLNLGSDYNTDLSNKEGRFSVWERNAGAAIQRPFGYGLNTFSYVDNMYGGTYKAPHNSLLQVWVELGSLACSSTCITTGLSSASSGASPRLRRQRVRPHCRWPDPRKSSCCIPARCGCR